MKSLILFGVLALPLLAFSETVTTSTQSAPQEAVAAPTSPLGLLLSASVNTDRRAPTDGDKKRNLDLTANPTYKLNNKTTFSLVVAGNKDLVGERKWTWEDAYAGATQKIGKTGPDTVFSLVGRAYYPLSELSKDYATLRTSLYFGPQVTVGPQTLNNLPLKFIYRPYATLNFHKYQVGLSGDSNNQYALSHRLIAEITLSEKFAITLDNIYRRAWTYTGVTRDNYSLDWSLGYQATEAMTVSLGHSYGGSPLRPNGRENSFSLYNDNVSIFYLRIDYQL